METISTTSTSKNTLEAEDIILRKTTTTRLIFKPLIINNESDPEACIRGCFIFQKKGQTSNWEDINEFPLSKLKKEEYIKLELKAEEILMLFSQFDILRNIYKEHGITYGTNEYHILDSEVYDDLLKIINHPHKNSLIAAIQKLNTSDLNKFAQIVNFAQFQKLLDIWEANKKQDKKEEFWHKVFEDNTWVLSQVFATPFVHLHSKFFCGGKDDDNTGGVYGDFLYKNSSTNNLAFIEIKTPNSKLIGNRYRGNDNKANLVYSISDEVTGGVNQLLNQKNTYSETNAVKANNSKFLHNVKCILIIGNLSSLDTLQTKSFELYRGTLNNHIEVITYDELFGKIKIIKDLFTEYDNTIE